MVATVGECGGDVPQDPEQPGSGQMCPHQCWCCCVCAQVDQQLFQRVTVEGGHGARGSPVMVHLVDVFVQE